MSGAAACSFYQGTPSGRDCDAAVLGWGPILTSMALSEGNPVVIHHKVAAMAALLDDFGIEGHSSSDLRDSYTEGRNPIFRLLRLCASSLNISLLYHPPQISMCRCKFNVMHSRVVGAVDTWYSSRPGYSVVRVMAGNTSTTIQGKYAMAATSQLAGLGEWGYTTFSRGRLALVLVNSQLDIKVLTPGRQSLVTLAGYITARSGCGYIARCHSSSVQISEMQGDVVGTHWLELWLHGGLQVSCMPDRFQPLVRFFLGS